MKRRQVIPFRVKRTGKTDYKKRLKLLLSKKPRLVVRRSLKNIIAQIVEYKPEGDVVVVSATSQNLKKYGWNISTSNIPASYLTGIIIGKKALKKGVKEAIVDAGFRIRSARVYALVKGAIDAGLKTRANEKVLPKEEIVKGKRIKDYALKLKSKPEIYKKQFSGYIKNNIEPENIDALFENVKKKIMEES